MASRIKKPVFTMLSLLWKNLEMENVMLISITKNVLMTMAIAEEQWNAKNKKKKNQGQFSK